MLMEFDNILISLHGLFGRECSYQMSQAALSPMHISHRRTTEGIRNLSQSHPKHDTPGSLGQNTDIIHTHTKKKKNI